MTFRNIDVSPDAPVAEWGFEGMLCALERGDVADWQRLYVACADVRATHLRQTLAQALRALERGDIHPQLADVFRNALNFQKLSNEEAGPKHCLYAPRRENPVNPVNPV